MTDTPKEKMIRRIARATDGVATVDTTRAVLRAFTVIARDMLNEGEEVPLTGIGKLKVKMMGGHPTHQIHTGEMGFRPRYPTPKFRASEEFKVWLRRQHENRPSEE